MNKLALLLFVVLVACATPPLEPFTLTGSCRQSCPEVRRSCSIQGTSAANRCFSSCFGSRCFSCDAIGDSIEGTCLHEVAEVCGTGSSGCPNHDFNAQVGGHDLALEERCVDYMNTCGTPENTARCSHFAHVEDPTAIAVYECFVENECNADACPMPTPDEALASEYVASIEVCGWTSPIEEPELAEWFGWLRQDVRDSLRDCLDMFCDEGRVQCANEWIETVYP